MTYANPRDLLKQYNQTGAHSAGVESSPHRLVQMLLEGALDKIAVAKGHMQRNEIAEKGRHVSWAISIVNGLRASLDKSAGGQIADNLDQLYDYMERRLLQANMENDVGALDEVARLLGELKSAWDAIAVEIGKKPAAVDSPVPAAGGISVRG